ncbi:MAG: 4Fe-4S dicluster domain-containing protein [Anaerolineae bacterium]|nr:4Fe-4S dicluster domain-containing protein [Anaerolineae bacterium]MDW8070307.1 4Fe-4S dicluster domain-containing protein [Anaerolineae bacterium]
MPKGRIVIHVEACKGCQLCTSVCPSGLIRMSASFNRKGYRPAELVDPTGRCTGCALCAMICPDAAIEVYREAKVKPHAAPPVEEVVVIVTEPA